MKKSFNLKKHLIKTALADGVQEPMRAERKQMDRQKKNLDEGDSAWEAWQKAQKEYDSGYEDL